MHGIEVSKTGTYFEQLLVVVRPRLGVHGDGLEDGVGDLLRVPRVHDDRAVQTLRGTRKLGQDHHTLAFLLARDVFIAHKIHPIAS